MEYLEYALDNEIILTGQDGTPVLAEGEGDDMMLMTGDPVLDAEEERWARQRPLDELADEYWKGKDDPEEDLLESIKAEVAGT